MIIKYPNRIRKKNECHVKSLMQQRLHTNNNRLIVFYTIVIGAYCNRWPNLVHTFIVNTYLPIIRWFGLFQVTSPHVNGWRLVERKEKLWSHNYSRIGITRLRLSSIVVIAFIEIDNIFISMFGVTTTISNLHIIQC